MIHPKKDHKRQSKLEAFDRLITIMAELRLNCPWDKKQTIQSIRHLTIEETFELSEAIINEDTSSIEEELGDLMLHIVFYAQIGSETEVFDLETIVNKLSEKLIRRHPHIYEDIIADDEEQVKKNWERIKLQEKKTKGEQEYVLSGVPTGLPPLLQAMRLQEKAKGVGFDWRNQDDVWCKVKEEIIEFEEECASNGDNLEKQQAEFGDLMFSLINYARHIGINPEAALQQTNQKFKKRFIFIEDQAKKVKKDIFQLSLAEMEKYWEIAKSKS